nr:uncharacterized mitochondrial protein AtMg00810-like [Tanacetum cinerariifolium]
MLKKFDMESVRTTTTPYEVPKPKSKDESDDAVNVRLFRSMIGFLMYLTASRPDIKFAVSACFRHQVTPMTSHLNIVKKIFKYIKGQPNLGLWYPRDSPFQLEAYSDSDYVGSHGDRKSTTGGCQFLGRRDANEKNLIQVLKIHTDENVADLLTKAFNGPRFYYLASNTAGSTSVPAGGTDDIISELPPYFAITPNEPVDSLSMGDEHLDTVPATESDEFIKSCVENLVSNPSESEGDSECDMPADFTTFSNVLFDADYDFDSDQHSFNAESDLIGSMPNHDSSITISSKIDSLFDEFAGELTLLKSISPRIDETDCHPEKETRPPEEIVSDNSNADIETFSPSFIPVEDSDSHIEEIDLSFNPDDPMPPSIEDDDYDSGMDIPILEELLDNYSLSLPKNESYHFDILLPYRPPAKPPDGKTGTLNIKIICDVSDQKVPIPGLTITRILNQEKSPDLVPHQGLEAF